MTRINASFLFKETTVPGAVGTIPPNEDPSLGGWSNTDLYDRQILLNKADKKFFVRVGNQVFSWSLGSANAAEAVFGVGSVLTIDAGLLSAGTDVEGLTAIEFLTAAFLGYVAPSFSSFNFSGSKLFEVGDLIEGDRDFSWSFSNVGNVAPDTLSIIDVSGGNNPIASSQSIISPLTQSIGSITPTTSTSLQYRASVLDANGNTIFSSIQSIRVAYKRYFGFANTDSPTDSDLTSGSGELVESEEKTVTDTPSGNQYYYFAYPNSHGSLSEIKVNGFNSISAFTETTRNVINVNGESESYKIYVSNNQFSTSSTFEFIP